MVINRTVILVPNNGHFGLRGFNIIIVSEIPTNKDVRKNFPDDSENFPDVSKNFPDVGKIFPDVSKNFPDVRKFFPDT